MNITTNIYLDIDPRSHKGTLDVPFSELVRLASEPVVTERKASVPLIVFARMTDPLGRRAKEASHATLAAFDIDGVPVQAFHAFVDSLAARDITYLWHSTFSHLDVDKQRANNDIGPGRYRLFIPQSRDITNGEFKPLRRQIIEHVFKDAQIQPDKATNDIVRMYYLPSHHPERANQYEWGYHEGAPIPIDTIKATVKVVDKVDRERTIRRDDVSSWIKRYKRRKAFRGDVAEAMRLLVDGGIIAEPGEREKVIRDITWELARAFPDVTSASIAELFAPSILLMASEAPDGALTVPDVVDRFERALEKVEEDNSQKLRAPVSELESNLAIMWGTSRGVAEDHEIVGDAARLGLTPSNYLKHALILRIGGQAYVRHLPQARYSVVGRDDMVDMCRQMLCVYPEFEAYKETEFGRVTKSPADLTTDYGSIIVSVDHDMTINDTILDLNRQTLVVSPCPQVQIAPAYDWWTDTWLRQLAGPEYDRLLAWLSKYTDLRQPLPALYLEGAPNAGKSLFSSCLASLYGNGNPVDAEDALGEGAFNAAIVDNPLVLADEYFPTDWRGNPNTHILRKFIQERVKTLRKKYAQNSRLIGCHRVIISANNGDALTFKHGVQLTTSDVRAIEDRVIHIHIPNHVSEWLKEQAREGALEHYVENRTFARHVLWLAENHQVRSAGRFFVEGSCRELINKMVTSGDVADGICEIIVRSILRSDDMAKTGDSVFFYHDKTNGQVELCVIPRGISTCWGSFALAAKRPTPQTVNKVLGSLRSNTKQVMRNGRRSTVSFINIERLTSYAQSIGLSTDEIAEHIVAHARHSMTLA